MSYKDPNDERARESRRKHYRNNKEQYFARNYAANAKKREWLNELKNVPCMDCGGSFPPCVMDFDHRDPSQKDANVSRLARNSWRKIKEEVLKCDIVCSNCHRIRTHLGVEPDGTAADSKPATTAFDS